MSAGSTTRLGFEHVLVRGSGAGALLLLHATGGADLELVADWLAERAPALGWR